VSTYTSTEWTCDRCGCKEEASAGGLRDQPMGWAALWEVKPPLMNPNESDKKPEQICRACVDAYYDWFTSGRLSKQDGGKQG
jgi:hypothetical protein